MPVEPTQLWQGGLTIPDCQVSDAIIGEAMDLVTRPLRFSLVLKHLGVKYIRPAFLTGTIDGQELPDKVLLQNTTWPPGSSYASTAIHGAIHLEQQRHPWGGLGLEIMAHTAELLFLLLLDKDMQDYAVRVQLARLEYYLKKILDAEVKMLEGVKP